MDRRANLVKALRGLTPEMIRTLDFRKSQESMIERPDFLWHSLLVSFSTMLKSRGYYGLIENPTNYNRVSYQVVKVLPAVDRIGRFDSTLRAAKVRMPSKKATWLEINFVKIEKMGGAEKAKVLALAAPGRQGKIKFMKQFHGIGSKYARNIWMDVYHPEFRDSIAIDSRIKIISEALDFQRLSYEDMEQAYLEIARDAGLSGWELDRLLYNFTGFFLSVLTRA